MINRGFTTDCFIYLYKLFVKDYDATPKDERIQILDSGTIEEIKAHCIKNGLGLLTENDFFYPNGGKLKSINGNKISGHMIVLKPNHN